MKPAPFAYVRPSSVDEVLDCLADGESKVIAGGQSLIPVLAMRLGRPATLVDINSVAALTELRLTGGTLQVGATVRQRTLEHSAEIASVPLLALALPFVGHRELRSRGTVCGSLAHADPAAELPAVACCLNAQLRIAGPGGHRDVAAEDFFAGALTTALRPDEILVSVRFPVAGPGTGFGFAEIARRHGDFALAGVATTVAVEADGTLRTARLAAFGVSDRPVTRDVTELLALAGSDEPALAPGLRVLADEIVDTEGDAHGSAGYRRRLLAVLAGRELSAAHRRAQARRTGP